MPWVFLIIAGIMEIGWAVGLKFTHGFTKLWPSVGTGACMLLSFVLLANAIKTIPIGTGYAVWTGIGAAGTAIVGMLLLGESRDPIRVVCVFVVIAGIVGLKVFSK